MNLAFLHMKLFSKSIKGNLPNWFLFLNGSFIANGVGLFLLFSPIFAHAQKLTVHPEAKEVTVFYAGAQVKSDFKVRVPAGASTWVIPNLSPNILKNSVLLSGLQMVRVRSIEFDINLYTELPDFFTQQKDIEKSLKIKNREIMLVAAQKQGIEEELSILTQNRLLGSDVQSVNLEKLQKHSTYYRQQIPVLKEAIDVLNERKKMLESQRDSLHVAANNRGNFSNDTGQLTIEIDNPQSATELSVVLTYQVSEVGWEPTYDIRATQQSDSVQVVRKAEIYQHCGENWKGVKLMLSTGDPSLSFEQPEVNPQYLSFSKSKNAFTKQQIHQYNPKVKHVTGVVRDETGPLPAVNIKLIGTNKVYHSDFDGKYELDVASGTELEFSFIGYETETIPIYAAQMDIKLNRGLALQEVVVSIRGAASLSSLTDKDGVADYKDKEPAKPQATAEVGVTSITYTLPTFQNLLSNEKTALFELESFPVPAIFNYVTTPLLQSKVYLLAVMQQMTNYQWQAGRAQIYLDENFAGTTFINPDLTDADMKINLGTDASLTVARKPVTSFSNKSLFGGTKKIQKGFELSVHSAKEKLVQVEITDRIPVSQQQEIVVDDLKLDGAEHNEKTGVLTWELTIQPKETIKKTFSYRVSYPADQRVNVE
ncbi:MAG: hypothetical protein CFE24_05860 [Flavobacterium sp. BFFFF2]|nr:MAG: hypothetical protein CFE24_05860 [Flavobacterium sp. BFFFF2]